MINKIPDKWIIPLDHPDMFFKAENLMSKQIIDKMRILLYLSRNGYISQQFLLEKLENLEEEIKPDKFII